MVFHEFILTLDATLRSLLAAIIILALLYVESKLLHMEGQHSSHRMILHRLLVIAVYFVGAGAALYLTGTHTLILGAQDQRPLLSAAVELFLIWVTSKFIVHNFSGMFKKLDDHVNAIDLTEHEHMLIRKGFRYMVYFAALALSLQALGLVGVLTALLAGAGFAGIVIGFAAKDVLANLFAGITLIMDKPFRIGDFIQVIGSDTIGTVAEISLRSTTIVTIDNTVLIVPNSVLATSVIVNYTINAHRKLTIPVGIAYEASIPAAHEAIKRALSHLPFVIRADEMEILVNTFGQSSVDMEVRVWVDTKKEGWGKMKTVAMERIKEEFDKSGIEIAYPKRVIIHRETVEKEESTPKE